MGAALLAGFGVGLFANLDQTASAWIQLGKTVTPNRDLLEHYGQRLARYERLLNVLGDWAES